MDSLSRTDASEIDGSSDGSLADVLESRDGVDEARQCGSDGDGDVSDDDFFVFFLSHFFVFLNRVLFSLHFFNVVVRCFSRRLRFLLSFNSEFAKDVRLAIDIIRLLALHGIFVVAEF